mmetsp:Transcript_16525/g.25664  ORF Transcript_16525/g.25664 Transcript_16525/m.25664 type:complete len:256 (+) Transcript_16525:91-858(+)
MSSAHRLALGSGAAALAGVCLIFVAVSHHTSRVGLLEPVVQEPVVREPYLPDVAVRDPTVWNPYVPDVSVNDVQVPDIHLPEISVRDISVPDVSVGQVNQFDVSLRGMLQRVDRQMLRQQGYAVEEPGEDVMDPGSLRTMPSNGKQSLRMMMLSGSGAAPEKEQGHCFADTMCGNSCEHCPKCQCLMTDGRVLGCEYGKCQCEDNCLCEDDGSCPKVCGVDYTPELCGGQFCRAGKCHEAFDLSRDDEDFREPPM